MASSQRPTLKFGPPPTLANPGTNSDAVPAFSREPRAGQPLAAGRILVDPGHVIRAIRRGTAAPGAVSRTHATGIQKSRTPRRAQLLVRGLPHSPRSLRHLRAASI